jgi:hypothetical protein
VGLLLKDVIGAHALFADEDLTSQRRDVLQEQQKD